MHSTPCLGHFRRPVSAICVFVALLAAFSTALVAADLSTRKAAFNIAAGPASETLKLFAAQSRTQLIYAVDVADGIPTNAIKGTLAINDAIDQLLAGTGLAAMERDGALAINRVSDAQRGDAPKNGESRPASSRTAQNEDGPVGNETPVQLSAFQIRDSKDRGYFAKQSISGMKTQAALIESPGNIAVVPRDLIDDIGEPFSAGATLQFVVSGVGMYTRSEQLSIRGNRTGFALVDDIPDFMYVADSAAVDSYEVLKGPTAVLYGASSSIFGLVIKTQKAPLPEFRGDLTQSFGNGGYQRSVLDLTGPIAHGFSYRLIGAYQEYDGVNPSHMDDRKVLAATLQWAHGGTTVRVAYEHAEIVTGLTGNNTTIGTTGAIRPWASPLGKYFQYLPPFGDFAGVSNGFRARIVHEFSSNWQSRVFWNRMMTERNYRDEPQFSSSLAANTFNIGFFDYDLNIITEVYGTDTIGKYEIAGLQLQTNFGWLYNSLAYSDQEFANIASIYSGSLTNPGNLAAIPLPAHSRGKPNNFAGTATPDQTLYFMETVKPIPHSDRLIILGGAGRVSIDQPDEEVTATVWRAGFVFKVVEGVALYGQYATRFTPTSGLIIDYYGNRLPNETDIGSEVGIKTDLFDHRLSITFDVYKMEQTDAYVGAALNSPVTGKGYYIPIPTAKDVGLELDVHAQLTPNWQLIVAAWSGTDKNSAGVQLDGTRTQTAGMFTRYNFSGALKRWSIGGGAHRAGRMDFKETTGRYIPGYTTTSAFVSYRFNRSTTATLNVANLFDERYILNDPGDGSSAQLGDPRTIRFTINYKLF